MNDFTLKCSHYEATDNDEVKYYLLEISCAERASLTIPVEPKNLASHTTMKRIFLDHALFYATSKTKHNEMLKVIFNEPPTPP